MPSLPVPLWFSLSHSFIKPEHRFDFPQNPTRVYFGLEEQEWRARALGSIKKSPRVSTRLGWVFSRFSLPGPSPYRIGVPERATRARAQCTSQIFARVKNMICGPLARLRCTHTRAHPHTQTRDASAAPEQEIIVRLLGKKIWRSMVIWTFRLC